jgi:hypothetical protein
MKLSQLTGDNHGHARCVFRWIGKQRFYLIWDDRQSESDVIDAAIRWSDLLRPHQMNDLIIEIISDYVDR